MDPTAPPPWKEPHMPITDNETSMEPPKSSSKNTLLTLASILVLVGIVGITLFLYIQNRSATKTPQTTNTPKTSDTKTQTGSNEVVVGAKNQELVKKYGAICKRFTSVEEALKESEVACVLDLSNQGLESLSPKIADLSNLNEINLSNNNFSSFPEVLYNKSSLLLINLSNNKLTITPDLSKLTSLQLLILTGNPITNKTAFSSKKNSLPGTPTPKISNTVITY
jgi:Leucine-rich repeat (LRR) protein